MKEYLLTAGPTPVPERVLLAMARPMLYHRAPAFTECLREVQEGMKWLMQTKQQPLLLTGSGTIAMDAAVCNFLRTGDKAVVIRGGKFGERWGKICEAYGITCVYVDVEWGKSVDAKAVAEAIDKNPGVRAVYATACETSTATKHDIEAIAKVVRAHDDIIICVDAITAIGVYDVPVDKWGLDVVAVGSQKALMLPPGLAAISVSEKAWKANERSNLPALLPGPGARAKSAGEGRDRLHAGRLADRRPARVAAHVEGRDAGRRVQPPRAAGQGDARRVRAAWGWISSRRRR